MSAKARFAPKARARGRDVGDGKSHCGNTGDDGGSTNAIGTAILPEPEVIQVLLPDGEIEVRLAAINSALGILNLRQVSLNEKREVVMGSEVPLKLASIGDASVEGKVVRLRTAGKSGKVLLELRYETEERARIWTQALQHAIAAAAAAAEAQPTTAPHTTNKGTIQLVQPKAEHIAPLRELIKQQEEQVSLLDVINQKKAEQLLAMQHKLEDALSELQEIQVTYAQQQRIFTEQHKEIERLKQQQIANSAASACMLNAAAAASGAVAAAQAGAAGPVAAAATAANMRQRAGRPASVHFDAPDKPKGAAQQGSVMPPLVGPVVPRSPTVESHQSSAPQSNKNDVAGANVIATGNAGQDPDENRSDDFAEEDDEEEERVLLEKLRELESEKGKFEAQLRDEQNDIKSQLHDLQGMMAALGLGGGADDASGGTPEPQPCSNREATAQAQAAAAAQLREEQNELASQLQDLRSMLAALASGSGGDGGGAAEAAAG